MSDKLDTETEIRHLVITESEARGLNLHAARTLRDRWIEKCVRDVVWDGGTEEDEGTIAELIGHIAYQDWRARGAFSKLRLQIRRHDEPVKDRLAERLGVFNALCERIADLERRHALEAFRQAGRPMPNFPLYPEAA